MTSPLQGIIPPLATPFRPDGSIDYAAHRAEVSFLIEKVKVHGIAVTGSTGEGYTLSADEFRSIAAGTVDEAAGRVPVIVGVIENSTANAIERGRLVADLPVAALQVTPVHYLFRPDDEEMVRYFGEIADRTGLPVIIYNVVPWSYLSADLVARVMRECDGVIGVKQSNRDLKTLADLMLLVHAGKAGKDPRVFSAVDALLYPSFLLGAHGTISAIAAAAPEDSVALWNAFHAGDQAECLRLHERLLRLWNAIDAPNLPANVKTSLRLQGHPGAGLPRPPMAPSSPEQVERIRQALSATATAIPPAEALQRTQCG